MSNKTKKQPNFPSKKEGPELGKGRDNNPPKEKISSPKPPTPKKKGS